MGRPFSKYFGPWAVLITTVVALFAITLVSFACRPTPPVKPDISKLTEPDPRPRQTAELVAARALKQCGASAVVTVDLLPALSSLPEMTPGMFEEQLRDLVQFAVATDPELGLSPRDLSYTFADRLLVRQEWPEAPGLQVYGPTRRLSRAKLPTKDELLVLVPLGETEARRDRHVQNQYAEYRVANGVAPSLGRVVGYLIETERARARYCTLAEGPAEDVFHPERGRVTRTVAGLDDLREFLATTPELTSATCNDGQLTVEGVPSPLHADVPITPEHVATLYGPVPARARDDPEVIALADAMTDVRWIERLVVDKGISRFVVFDTFHTIGEEIERRAELYPWLDEEGAARWLAYDLLLRMRISNAIKGPASVLEPEVTLLDKLARAYAYARWGTIEPERSFSLDIVIPPDFKRNVARMRSPTRVRALLEDYFDVWRKTPEAREATLARFNARALAKRFQRLSLMLNVNGLAALHQEMKDTPDHLSESLIELFKDRNAQQCARYEGPLTGTEVGMVMFHTDLGMKLYDHDYAGLARRRPLPEHAPALEYQYTPRECTLPNHGSARMWIELRQDRFARSEDKRTLRFAPSATAVYSAMTNDRYGRSISGLNVEPGIAQAAQWWTDHYRELSIVEREYARQDELLKWGAVMVWLADHPRCHAQIDFLKDVPVKRDWTYADWTAAHRGRLWRSEHPEFHKIKGSKRECIDVLISHPFDDGCGTGPSVMIGGVSAPDSTSLANAERANTALHAALRDHEGLRAAKVEIADGVLNVHDREKKERGVFRYQRDRAAVTRSGARGDHRTTSVIHELIAQDGAPVRPSRTPDLASSRVTQVDEHSRTSYSLASTGRGSTRQLALVSEPPRFIDALGKAELLRSRGVRPEYALEFAFGAVAELDDVDHGARAFTVSLDDARYRVTSSNRYRAEFGTPAATFDDDEAEYFLFWTRQQDDQRAAPGARAEPETAANKPAGEGSPGNARGPPASFDEAIARFQARDFAALRKLPLSAFPEHKSSVKLLKGISELVTGKFPQHGLDLVASVGTDIPPDVSRIVSEMLAELSTRENDLHEYLEKADAIINGRVPPGTSSASPNEVTPGVPKNTPSGRTGELMSRPEIYAMNLVGRNKPEFTLLNRCEFGSGFDVDGKGLCTPRAPAMSLAPADDPETSAAAADNAAVKEAYRKTISLAGEYPISVPRIAIRSNSRRAPDYEVHHGFVRIVPDSRDGRARRKRDEEQFAHTTLPRGVGKIHWSELVIGRFHGAEAIVLMYDCDADDDARVTETEFLNCACDTNFDQKLETTKERACVDTMNAAARVEDNEPGFSEKEVALLYCDYDGDHELKLSAEQHCHMELQ